MRRLTGEQTLVRIFFGESDKWHHRERLDEMLNDGLVTMEKVRVLRYAAARK